MLDELASGVPAAGAPDIERTFRLDHAATTTTLFLAPAIVGFIVEPVIYLLADRYLRRWFVAGGFAAMAVAALAAALAP
ncbi:MAG TPA: hypothetical protein VFQ53_29785, partial [Kofleriaceae bacterium]|nr:hypothetical protein [Kofleriaceae bacterium]